MMFWYILVWFAVGYVSVVLANRLWYSEFGESMPVLFLILVGLGPMALLVPLSWYLSNLADEFKERHDNPKNRRLWRRLTLWKSEE
jgi:hypothetical protein